MPLLVLVALLLLTTLVPVDELAPPPAPPVPCSTTAVPLQAAKERAQSGAAKRRAKEAISPA